MKRSIGRDLFFYDYVFPGSMIFFFFSPETFQYKKNILYTGNTEYFFERL